MAITRYEKPVSLLQQLNQEMNELTSRWFGRSTVDLPQLADWPARDTLFTPIDISDSDGELIVKMDVPGAKSDEIKVECNGDMLTISGERKEEKSEKKGEVFYTERQSGSFMRRLALPTAVKQDQVQARYKDGVLEVHLPKAEQTQTKSVKVEKG